jgi:uncharacterized protein
MRLAIYSFIFVTFVGNANAASFDCSKASTAHEKAICASPSLSALDIKLAEIYKTVQATTSDATKLKAEQVAWIKETRVCGGDVACLERSYNARINELAAKPAPIDAPVVPTASIAAVEAPVSTTSVASEAAPVASEPTAPQSSEPVATPPQVSPVEEKRVPIWEDKYVKLGGGMVFALVLLALAYWLIKKLVIGVKKGAEVVGQTSVQVKQQVAEKTSQLVGFASEKAASAKVQIAETAVNMAAHASSATQTAASAIKDTANKPEVKSAVGTFIATVKTKAILFWSIYLGLFRKSPWLTGLATLFVIGVLFGESGSGGDSGGSERTPDGLTKAQWYQRCEQYENAKQQCAVANNISRCIETKVGELVSGMAGMYCKGNTPDFYLMGVK